MAFSIAEELSLNSHNGFCITRTDVSSTEFGPCGLWGNSCMSGLVLKKNMLISDDGCLGGTLSMLRIGESSSFCLCNLLYKNARRNSNNSGSPIEHANIIFSSWFVFLNDDVLGITLITVLPVSFSYLQDTFVSCMGCGTHGGGAVGVGGGI